MDFKIDVPKRSQKLIDDYYKQRKRIRYSNSERVVAVGAAAVMGFIAADLPGAAVAAEVVYYGVSGGQGGRVFSGVGVGKGPPFLKRDKSPFNLPKYKYIVV